MTRNEILQAGGIEFWAGRAFPFGSEFAFVGKAESRGAWNVTFSFGVEGDEQVEALEGDLTGRRFVVIHECRRSEERYACLALPVEHIDERTTKIEEGVVAKLLCNPGPKQPHCARTGDL